MPILRLFTHAFQMNLGLNQGNNVNENVNLGLLSNSAVYVKDLGKLVFNDSFL